MPIFVYLNKKKKKHISAELLVKQYLQLYLYSSLACFFRPKTISDPNVPPGRVEF